ncbi:MAG: hemerythrin domain-containing protein [Rubrivivax sp.]|jgi:hemerythrin-like metal-binding protein|nr:hemerythrin domain-containing protein [Rubrivivax sp.]
MPPSLPLPWSDALLLGYPEMDAEHREFVQLVGLLQTAPDAELGAHLAAFEAHARQHFGSEDAWMERTAFPPRDCHQKEHAAVLQSLQEVQALHAAFGRCDVVRSFAYELARWFPGHADYLDSALAAWMSKRRHGGRPVVLKRHAATPHAHPL